MHQNVTFSLYQIRTTVLCHRAVLDVEADYLKLCHFIHFLSVLLSFVKPIRTMLSSDDSCYQMIRSKPLQSTACIRQDEYQILRYDLTLLSNKPTSCWIFTRILTPTFLSRITEHGATRLIISYPLYVNTAGSRTDHVHQDELKTQHGFRYKCMYAFHHQRHGLLRVKGGVNDLTGSVFMLDFSLWSSFTLARSEANAYLPVFL